jgi:hypothetical protein
MAFEQVKVWDIVDRAVGHKWSIPEFQRGFVWKATQVRDLAESMWQNFPIGSLLVWNARNKVEEQIAVDAQTPSLWLVDGQQRTTALCVRIGRKPYWWSSAEGWNKLVKRYDIRFDVDAKEPPFFSVANAATRRAKGNRYVPLSRLLTLDLSNDADQKTLMDLAKQIKEEDLCHGMDSMEVYTRLDRVRKIRDMYLVTVTVDHELEDVVEIFSRLNSKGTRVTEADIYLGVVAARTPGWVRDEFLPFRGKLADAGFDIGPNLLFRSLTAIGISKTRFREIPDHFWNADAVLPSWQRTKSAWQSLVNRFRDYGILSNDPMPTETALVTMVALIEKFPAAPFGPLLAWFLTASRFNRYSGSATTSLERPPSEDETLGFDIQFDFGQLDTEVQEAVVFMVTYKIEVDGEVQSLVAVAEAAYAVECTAPGPPPPGFLEVFGPMNLSRLVYPFFREQVAGITAKMELPTLFVPLNIFGGKRQEPKEKST